MKQLNGEFIRITGFKIEPGECIKARINIEVLE